MVPLSACSRGRERVVLKCALGLELLKSRTWKWRRVGSIFDMCLCVVSVCTLCLCLCFCMFYVFYVLREEALLRV